METIFFAFTKKKKRATGSVGWNFASHIKKDDRNKSGLAENTINRI